MIPTMIVYGLVVGRWWKTALLTATLGWPTLLLIQGPLQSGPGFLTWSVLLAAFLGLANAAVGVGVHQGILALIRWLRSSKARASIQSP